MTRPSSYPSRTMNAEIIYLGDVEELHRFQRNDRFAEFGSMVTLDEILSTGKTVLPHVLIDNIQMINKPDGYNAELVTESRLVTVRGPEEAVDALFQSQLRIVVDLSQAQLATGRQTVQAQVIIDGSSDVGVLGGEYDVLVNFTLAE